ncbi:hypothetical protein SLA2020_399000 [Shorea laevis]
MCINSEKAAVAPPPLSDPSLPPSSIALSPLSDLYDELIDPKISNIWRELDVRAMVLLSLFLQIALFVLGMCRKQSVSPINKTFLWLAYQSKDWVIIAALGKLSTSKLTSHFNSPDPCSIGEVTFQSSYHKLLTSLWTPLLIFHLGGPDTITAFSFQDTQLWSRHLLTLVVQCFLTFCVIIWSSIYYNLIFTIPLYFVGISKYIEKILCLKLTNSQKTKQTIPVFKNPGLPSHPLLENQESKLVLLGYALFTAMRPEVNDYLCHKEYPMSFKVRTQTYLRETSHEVQLILKRWLGGDEPRSSRSTHFDIAVVELGFIFDVVYTKAAFIYTRKGCILRLTSFTLSVGTLVSFLILLFKPLVTSKIAEVDVCLTMILLVGTVALDICAVLSILYSD